MYGSDYPCWMPAQALEYFDKIGLSAADQEKILNTNARRILGLRMPVKAEPVRETAPA
jgi:aminocarboxymuconate-semialdehyde decarboxylase